MKVTVELPVVSACAVTRCAYNGAGSCHAQAITVGDGDHPACDAYFPATQHVKSQNIRAGVGACSVSSCRYNTDYKCGADAIHVGVHADHADCLTFERTASKSAG